jgi:hypothetical protein
VFSYGTQEATEICSLRKVKVARVACINWSRKGKLTSRRVSRNKKKAVRMNMTLKPANVSLGLHNNRRLPHLHVCKVDTNFPSSKGKGKAEKAAEQIKGSQAQYDLKPAT